MLLKTHFGSWKILWCDYVGGWGFFSFWGWGDFVLNRENSLRCYGHVYKQLRASLVRKVGFMSVEGEG